MPVTNTIENQRRLQDILGSREGGYLLLEALNPPRESFAYPDGASVEACLAVESDGQAVVTLVSEDLEYRGPDETLQRLFRTAQPERGWRPLTRLQYPTATEVFSHLDALLGLDGHPPRVVHGWPRDREIVVPMNTHADRRDELRHDGERFGEDLVERARRGKLADVVGREQELEALVRNLSKLTKNSVCLVGPPGVGKTAVVEKLAMSIAAGDVPETLRGARLIEVNLGSLAAGASHRNEFEGRFKSLLDMARDDARTILFIDEVHVLCSAMNDASQLVKQDLGRGRIKLIGATTNLEWRTIEADAALARRFQVIPVAEPSIEETVQILARLRERIANHHGVEVPEDMLPAIVNLAVRYVSDRRLPDKAIDLLDEAAAHAAMQRMRHEPPASDTLPTALSGVAQPSVSHSREHRGGAPMNAPRTQLSLDSVYTVLAAWTGIPVAHLQAGDDLKAALDCLPDRLRSRIFGQDYAIEAAVAKLRRALTLKPDPRSRRPRAVLLCAGPSGTGKTEFARALAQEFHGDEKRFLKRIDMSEFTEEHTVSRLLGAPPGYVGYGRGGELVQAIKEARHGVLLLDEIEKCHPSVLTKALLPLIGDGIIHDMSTGELIDARNFVIVLTSNLGTNEHLDRGQPVQFGPAEPDPTNRVLAAVRARLPHEFLARIDEIIVFRPLSDEAVRAIWRREAEDLARRLSDSYGSVTLRIDPSAEEALLSRLGDEISREGARAVRRAFEKNVTRYCLGLMAEEDARTGAWVIDVALESQDKICFRRSLGVTTAGVPTEIGEPKAEDPREGWT